MISRHHILDAIPGLAKFCRSVSRGRRLAPWEAEDLHADAMVLAWKTADEFEDADLTGWRELLERKIKNRARKIASPYRRPQVRTTEPYMPEPLHAVEVADELESLPEEDQTLLACRAYDMTERETAKALGISQATVNRRLSAIRARLTA
jgi:RNA polymerase sigma factor (sigma-70 family)